MADEVKRFYREVYPNRWKNKVKEYGLTPYYQTVLELLPDPKFKSVLECGIGTGELLAIRVAGQQAKMYGVDISEILLRECQTNFATIGLSAPSACGDLENLPYADNSFEMVYSIATSWYMPDFAGVLNEMVRITKPQGLLIFDVLNALHITPLSQWLAARILRHFGREVGPWWVRTPWQIAKILNGLSVQYQVRGFYVLIPTAYPNLTGYSDWFSYKLQYSKLRFLGSNLVYICQVLK